MVYLLKEALKTLCGVNQWSYAVYWKIGCQNPKLLIWEECYYEPASYSGLLIGNGSPQTYNLESCIQSVDKVHFLINKMMEDNHVNIVGQGLVGRVALTGNHHWILSDNYFNETCPPQVRKEVFQQFSAGMKTVAVIPVLPHGVVQFGSYKTVMENMGFVQDVRSLICQLSKNYTAQELDSKIEGPECIGWNASPGEFSLESNLFNDSALFDSLNYFGNSAESQTCYSSTTNEIRNDPIPNISTFQASNSNSTHFKPHDYCQKAQINSAMKFQFSQLMNGVAKAEVIPSSAEIWMKNQHASSQYIPKPNQDLSSRSSSCLTNGSGQGHFSNSNVSTGILTSSGLAYNFSDGFVNLPSFEVNGLCHDDVTRIMEPDTKGEAVENLTSTNPNEGRNVSFGQTDKRQKFIAQIHSPNISRCDDAFLQPQSGDDLFDILGVDYKSNLLTSSLSSELATNAHDWDKSNFPSKASSEILYTSSRTDHLLDAVVSKINPLTKQSLDDNVSCNTTMTNVSSSFSAITSLPYGRFGVSDQLKEELLGVPKYQAKAGAMASSSFRTGSSQVTYSQCSSVYGSQESPWIGKGQIAKQNNSVSTGNSMKQGEMVKTNRKRLKPGENPRPRPKDRQMIQDRVKELREIVPHGAKCSIDALLERTIKHMLFLQSVTKHADKLKQTDESKIFSKDGGLVLKDNFDGGATWAYELGSQSMVCPIIVEDLDQPRQMLVEMLCEERGLFLEIADMIRGMGLTILKGVMETRNDKIWARFALEANRNVTRMEIFMSLVRLLDQTAKTCASQPNGLSCENMMVQSQ